MDNYEVPDNAVVAPWPKSYADFLAAAIAFTNSSFFLAAFSSITVALL
jgi:hypothetical protein